MQAADSMDDITIDIERAIKLLPQKIDQRKDIIASIQLDLAVANETDAQQSEVDELRKSLAQQMSYLKAFESRLEKIQSAVNGG